MSYPDNVEVIDDPADGTGNAYCHLIDTHFYLYSYWWVVIILQLLSPIILPICVYCCIDRPFEACGVQDCVERVGLSTDNMLTLLLQGSVWTWAGYLISVQCCGTPEPMLITAIVFLVLSYILNLTLLCSPLSVDAAVFNKATPEDYQEYLERTRNMAPRHMIKG